MDELAPSAPRLHHTITTSADRSVVVALDGELDIATADALSAAVDAALGPDASRLVLDVERLAFADSTAIALWVRWSRMVPRLEVRHARPVIRRVIETMGLADRLNPS